MAWRIDLRPPARARKVCTCGHEWEAHQHYRVGTDCSLCADGRCHRYVARRR